MHLFRHVPITTPYSTLYNYVCALVHNQLVSSKPQGQFLKIAIPAFNACASCFSSSVRNECEYIS